MTGAAPQNVDMPKWTWSDPKSKATTGECVFAWAPASRKRESEVLVSGLHMHLRRLALPVPGGYADLMKRVEIDLPDETLAGLDREPAELAAEIRAAAAAKLYEVGRVSQEVAAQIAGVSRSEFLTVLSRYKVSPMQETVSEALAGADVLLRS